MVFFEILLRHISDSGVYIAIIFSMVIEYLFMICSSVIFDKNILFQTRTPELSIWNTWTNHGSYQDLTQNLLLQIVTLHSSSVFGQIFSLILIGKLSLNSGCILYAFFFRLHISCETIVSYTVFHSVLYQLKKKRISDTVFYHRLMN